MTADDAATDDESELTLLRAKAALLETTLRETRETAERQLIHAEMKAEAIRSGMIDLDGLKLADSSLINIDANGVVNGVAAEMHRLKQEKPWLFGIGSSSSHAIVPAAAGMRQKLATDMSLDEWRAARADLLRRR